MELREYSERDRDDAHGILRGLLRQGDVPYTIHPGDWDWWLYHGDEFHARTQLIGAGAVVEVGIDQHYVSAFGLSARKCIDIGREYFGNDHFSVSHVSRRDDKRLDTLRQHGFTMLTPEPIFERSTEGGVDGAALADRFEIRPVAGPAEVSQRAGAARRAFATPMEPADHDARYARFMASVAYVRERDLVAVAPDGRVAAFAITWIDPELSLAQFEPVGADPDFQRRGLARAVIAEHLAELAAAGVRRARVTTNGTNDAAIALYLACGFEIVDHVAWWQGPGR